jgi:hypothetical protein
MSRTAFLTIAGLIAIAVGACAVVFPDHFLASKGTIPGDAANL